jgi:hypothetical protein
MRQFPERSLKVSRSYYYFGHDTLNMILVGDGRATWMNWGLMDHEGPIIHLDYLGYPEKRYAYLPEDLLSLLYERFLADNPAGASLVLDEQYLPIALTRRSREELDALCEEKKALQVINLQQNEEGYPQLRKYLPELFEPATLERLANDPWLDYLALRRAENLGVDKGGIPSNLRVERASRWSQEWRTYCDRLRQSPEAGTYRRRRHKSAHKNSWSRRLKRWWHELTTKNAT